MIYNIYANDGAGGPVDYTSAIGSTSALAFATAAIPAGSDFTFAVRAESGGLEESNVDCRVRVVTDGSGSDVTGRPAAPSGLTAECLAGGTIRVRWLASTSSLAAAPTGYRVYAGTPTVSYAAPVATVAAAGPATAWTDLAGLADGVTYQVGVRAFNATGEEPNTAFVSVTADASAPAAVEALTAITTSEG